MKISKKNQEILSKFYEIEGDNYLISFTYETFNEILNPHLNNRLSDEFIANVLEAIDSLPYRLKLKISLELNLTNETKYTKEEIMKILKENRNFYRYKFNIKNKRKIITSLGLVLMSIVFLGMSMLSDYFNAHKLIVEMLDISGWVFLWQAVTLYFLEFTNDRKKAKTIADKLGDFKLKVGVKK